MPGALDGIRVLDLTWGTAALGVLLLAEQGADTIKVEPPGGDPFRGYPGYKVWTRSRRSVTANLKSDAGRDAFLALAATADVVVDSFAPGVMDRLGIGSDTLRAANPRLVTCSVPAYPVGHRNQHRPGYDALVAAASGQQWDQPGWRPGPIFLPMPMPSSGMIWLVASGILSALHAREQSGRGQHVQTSLLQGVWLYTTQIWQMAEHGDAAYYGLMAKTYPPGIHQPMIFECADGYVHLSVMSGLTPKKSIDDILGLQPIPAEDLEGLISIEIYTMMSNRQRDAIKRWKRDDLVREFVANNHAVEAVVEPEAQFVHEQLKANHMVVTVDDPDLGATTQLGVPVHLLASPGAITSGQPRVGEHNTEVWGELGLDVTAITEVDTDTITAVPAPIRSTADPTVRIRALAEPGENRGPLDGVTLVDFGQYLAGPFGPMILGDLGMDVIKVEPVTGDGMRMAGTPFFGCQRGKRDIAINLKTPDGLALAMELVAKADVVHHNMTKGTAARLGLDYDACRAVNPNIIYCNTYAYGLDGPLSTFGGLDPLYQASAGLESELGATHHGNPPLYYRFGMCDAANAMLSVVGVLAALVHRDRTGAGQELWTSLMDGGAWHASDVLLHADGTPSYRPKVDAGQHGFGPAYRLYETQSGWIQIVATRDPEWAALGRVLDVDVSAAKPSDRGAAEAALEAAFLTKTAMQWTRALDDAGVPNEIAFDTKGPEGALYDADAERLGLVVEYPHPIMGNLRQFGALVNFSETPARVEGPPPRVGEDTLEILEWLGRRADADALNAAGVVYWPDDRYAWMW